MDQHELDEAARRQQERLEARGEREPEPCVHQWNTAYRSASGRKLCLKCGLVTDKPFETLGVGEG